MKKENIENLVGESMEDMGLEEQIKERECEDCGHILEDDNTRSICLSCQQKQLNHL